jgi:hypothetical protein
MYDTIPPYPIFEFPVVPSSLDTFTISHAISLNKEVISTIPETTGALFIIFTLFFLLSMQMIGGQWKMLLAMADGLWHSKGRQSIFYTTTGNEQYSKYILFTQSLLLLSVFVYKAYVVELFTAVPPTSFVLLIIGTFALLCFLFYCIKWLSYTFVGSVFFTNDKLMQWRTSFFSMISLSGIILFIPTLLFVFVDVLRSVSYYFILFYFICFGIVLIYKTYELFFPRRDTFLYLFLYLCAQEIIPLFFFYKTVVYLFNFFCKTTAIWL